jgi:hypothetical protein
MCFLRKRKNCTLIKAGGFKMSANLKTDFRRLPLLIFVLLLLPLRPCAASEDPDSPSAAPAIHTVAGSTENATTAPAAAQTASEKLMKMKTPTSILELIENLYEVHKSRIAFDEAFYTEENIRKITAGKDTNIRVAHNQGKKEFSTSPWDFRSIAGDLEADERVGISARISLAIKPDGKRSVDIYVSFSRVYPSLHYTAIEKLSSHAWQRSKPRPLGTFEVYRAPTNIHGNKRMEYTRQDGDVVEKGRFEFNPNGLLNRLSLYTEEQ